MAPALDVVGADDQDGGGAANRDAERREMTGAVRRRAAADGEIDAGPAAEIGRSDELRVGIARQQHAARCGGAERGANAGPPFGEPSADAPAVTPVAGGGRDPWSDPWNVHGRPEQA
ncbi:hypothetical protein ACRBEV_21285 [Methylobacterium phyllosphaerae]